MKKNALPPFPLPRSRGMLSPAMGWGIALIAVAIVAVALFNPPSLYPFSPNPIVTETPLVNIPRFSNENDILSAFKNAQQYGGGGIYKTGMDIMNAALPSAAVGESAAGGSGARDSSSGSAYSTTNVQVQGVDEADIVKTDGKYIYTFYKNKLVITLAAPVSEMRVVKTIFLDNVTPQEMFVQDNKLVLVGNRYESGPGIMYPEKRLGVAASGGSADSPLWYPYWSYSRIVIQEYDIANKENPQKVKELEFPGNYVSSRMIGNHAYFALTTYPEYRILNGEVKDQSIIPPYKEDGVEKPIARPTEIGYLPPMDAQSFITIVSLNTDTKQVNKETVVGRADQVFASQDNMYLSAAQWNYYGGGGIVRALPVVQPGGSTVQSEPAVNSVDGGAGVISEEETPTTVEPDATDGIAPPSINPPIQAPIENTSRTRIYKFHLDNGVISFQGRGEVPGTVLNQFSMDEYNAHFRIATTVEAQWSPNGRETSMQKNSVYVLDSEMKTVGALEDLAPGERIYSARFMGERAYLVTFKQIDPLFVLDLSNPENPRVLGKLKIPGYSNYLHPFDATHIIGIGKDTEESKEGNFAYYLGMKMAIFDVSDVENPIEQHTVFIGDRGTDSPALYDHKAFLFDREKELLVIPIDLHKVSGSQPNQTSPSRSPEYGQSVFQGAFVYDVSLENGFVEKGRITHIPKEIELKSGYYYDYRYQVQRSLYIADVLYTVSQKIIKANALSDLSEIKSVDLVNTPKNFQITVRSEGGMTAAFYQMKLNKDKLILDSSSGGSNPNINHSEQPAYSTYDDIVETLDWEAFQNLDDDTRCTICADVIFETITITNGSTTKTVKMDFGTRVPTIQPFLDAINPYIGYYGYDGGMYPLEVVSDTMGVSGSASAPPVKPI